SSLALIREKSKAKKQQTIKQTTESCRVIPLAFFATAAEVVRLQLRTLEQIHRRILVRRSNVLAVGRKNHAADIHAAPVPQFLARGRLPEFDFLILSSGRGREGISIRAHGESQELLLMSGNRS